MSRNLNLALRVTADGRPALVALDQVDDRLRRIGPAGRAAGRDTAEGMREARREALSLNDQVTSLRSSFIGLAATAAVTAVAGNLARGVVELSNANRGWIASLQASTGSLTRAREEYSFVAAESDRLGLSLRTNVSDFARLTAATRGTRLEGQQTRELFLGIAEASRTLNLSADATSGALLAVEQMISKGKVSAEELRGQLGERLPGAFRLAADAAGMTTAEFDGALARGEVLAEDLLPRLAQRLRELYGPQAAAEASSPAAEIQRLQNAVLELQVTAGGAGIMEALAEGARDLTAAVRAINDSGALPGLISGLGTLTQLGVVVLLARMAAAARDAAAGKVVLVQQTLATVAAERAAAASAAQAAVARSAEIAQTLQVVAAARAEELAKVRKAQADIAAAQATIAATSAMGAQSAAIRAQAIATDQLTAAKTRLTAATTALATLGQQEARLRATAAAATTAQIGAQAALAGATTASALAMSRLQAAGAGVVSLLGGPWGAAIVGGTLAVWGLSAAIENSEEWLSRISDEAARSAQAFAEATRSYNQSWAAYRQANPERIVQDLRANNLELERARQRAEDGGASAELYAAKVKILADRQRELAAELRSANPELLAQERLLTESRSAIDGVIAAAEKRANQLRRQIAEVQGGAAGALRFDLSELTRTGQAEATDATREQRAEIRRLVAELPQLEAQLKAAQGANAGYARSARSARDADDERARSMERLVDLVADWSGELTGGLSRALAQHSARLRQLQQIEAALARTQSLSAQSQAQLAQARELAAQSLRRAIEDQVAALGGPLAQAELEQRRRLEEIEVVRAQLIEQGEDAAAVERLVADAVARANREHAENARRLREREQPYSSLLRQLREEIDLLSLSTRARQEEALAIELRNRALAEGINLSEAEARAQARSIEAARRRAALEGRARDLTERGEAVFGLRIDAQLDEVFPFRTFGDLLAGATASGLERGIPGFLGTLSQGLRQAFDENPLQAAAGIADFAAQVIAQRRAGRDTAGSFLFAANQAAAQSGIPEAQAVAAVVSAIDSIFGGRLLGTAWERSGTGLRLGLGGGGVTGSTSETQVRQRSLFRGRQWRTTESPLDDAARGQLEDFLDQLREALRNGARALRTEVPPLIEGSFAEVRDATGRVISQTSTVLGRTYSESVEAFQRRLTAENLIALVDRALGGTVRAASEQAGQQAAQGIAEGLDRGIEDGGITLPKSIAAIQGEASAIAERWRADAERLLDGAQLLLRAATDLRGGFNLLGDGSLTQVVDLVEELAQSGEPLADAYVRVVGATRLLDEALALSGLTLDRTREDLVRFATEIADAAGGIDRATSLWATYFETFFTAEERAALSLRRAQERASTQLGDIGLDAAGFSGSEGLARFRALFEDVFATLSAEAVVEWLEAAEALAQLVAAAEGADGSLNNAAQALADLLAGVEAEIERLAPQTFAERIARIEQGLAETLARATELGATEEQLARIRLSGALQLQAVLDEQDAALRRYTDTVQGIRDTIADLSGLSEFGRQVREIERWARDTAAALNAQARAAGLASARTEDLALVQEAAALRMAAAIRALTQRGQSLVERLYGTALDQLNTQIGTLEGAIGSVGSAIGGVQEASDQLFRQQQQQVQRIRDFLDASLLTPQGGLRPRDQLQEALRQFGGLFTRAQGGDADALGNITGLSDTIFRLIRDVFGSSAQGDAIRAQIRAQLEQLAGLQFPGGGGTPGGTGAPVPPAELQELYRERERLLAQQAAAERRELATELLGIVADLVRATGEPLAAIAATLGFEMRALVEDLGVNLGELSDATAVRLADIAQSLGVNLSELSQSVGVDLGSLADSQSLLNNALEARIRALPTEQRDQLEPLLRGVEEAAALGDNALLEQRMAALIAATNSLPPLLRNSLAPFFDQVDPVFYDQLSALSAVDTNTYSIAETARSQLDVLIEIRDRLEEPQPVEPPPEEMILGKAGLYAAQIEAAAAAATGDSVAAELRALLAAQREIAEALRSVSERIEALELATVNAAGEQTDAVDRLVDTLRTR